jgi:polyisoprenoid-binding protein YceI
MKTIHALAVAAALLTAGRAATAATPTDPASVRPGTYAIEPRHTRVLFAVEHFGISTWYGDFTHVSGTLKLDPMNPTASHVEVSMPTDSLSTTNAELDGALKGAEWFNAAEFPTIVFRSTKVTLTGPGRASVEGELTLKGVTRPVVLDATFKGAAGPSAVIPAYTIGFDLRGRIKRSAFGINRYLGTISDDVDLIISAPFERKSD